MLLESESRPERVPTTPPQKKEKDKEPFDAPFFDVLGNLLFLVLDRAGFTRKRTGIEPDKWYD